MTPDPDINMAETGGADGGKNLHLLAEISHEMHTPLNAIIGFSEVIRGEMDGPIRSALYKSYIEDIHASGEHLLRIVNDILEMGRAEAGRIAVASEPVEPAEIARDALKMVASLAREGGNTITLAVAPHMPATLCDGQRLRQIMVNLLSNAVKFSPPGGDIGIFIRPDAAQNNFSITVRDYGIGMRPEDIPVALAPFEQIPGTAPNGHQGTGLGLPLSLRIAEALGGTLEIESAPGKGTAVAITLPVRPVPQSRNGAAISTVPSAA